MTRKRLSLIISSLLLVGVLWFLKYYFLDQSVVTFNVISSIPRVDVFTKSGSKVALLTGSGDLRLAHGDYYAVPAGDTYSTEHILFTSPSNSTVSINPDYSEEHLTSLADKAKGSVQTLLSKQYPSQMNQYTLVSFTLYKKGEWGGGLLARNDSTQNDTKDVYRFIIHDDAGWQIEQRPELILTQAAFSDAPADVLRAIDALTYSPLH